MEIKIEFHIDDKKYFKILCYKGRLVTNRQLMLKELAIELLGHATDIIVRENKESEYDEINY